MNAIQIPVSRTRSEWRATARTFRVHHPELAAKITIARLPGASAHPDEMLTIPFTPAEHDRLLAEDATAPSQMAEPKAPRWVDEATSTITDVEVFLGFTPT
jgi:hypothetical protein